MRWFVSLVIGLVGVGALGCGDSRTGTGSSSRDSATVEPGGIEAKRASDATRTGGHVYGDYDTDDYYLIKSSDGDDDDGHKPKDGDGDFDNHSKSYYDRDDSSVREFGHAANATNRRAIEALVRRYFRAAAAKDGALACSMITSPLARSIPEDLGQSPGPPFFSGKTCAVVMTKVFKENSRQLTTDAARLKINRVRLSHGQGVVVLNFMPLPGRKIDVAQEHGAWKIQALVDSELP